MDHPVAAVTVAAMVVAAASADQETQHQAHPPLARCWRNASERERKRDLS